MKTPSPNDFYVKTKSVIYRHKHGLKPQGLDDSLRMLALRVIEEAFDDAFGEVPRFGDLSKKYLTKAKIRERRYNRKDAREWLSGEHPEDLEFVCELAGIQPDYCIAHYRRRCRESGVDSHDNVK